MTGLLLGVLVWLAHGQGAKTLSNLQTITQDKVNQAGLQDYADKLEGLAHTVALELANEAASLQTNASEAKILAQDLAGRMKTQADSYVDFQRHAMMEATRLDREDNDNLARLNDEMNGEVEQMADDTDVAINTLKAQDIPMAQDIIRDTKSGVADMMLMDDKIKNERAKVTRGIARDAQTHNENLATLQEHAADWDTLYQDVNTLSQQLEMSLMMRTEGLKFSIEQETSDRKKSMKEMQKYQKDTMRGLNRGLKKVAGALAGEYRRLQSGARSFKVQAMNGIMQDVARFSADANKGIADLQSEAGKSLGKLSTKTEKTGELLDQVYQRLRAEAKTQKSFPRTAEKLLAQQGKASAEEFGAVRVNQRKVLSDTFKAFNTDADSQVERALGTVNTLKERQMQTAKRVIKNAKVGVKRVVQPAMDSFAKLHKRVQHLNARVEAANRFIRAAESNLNELPKERESASNNAKFIIHKYDRDLEDRATSVASGAEADIPQFLGKVKAAENAGKKKLDSRFTRLKREFGRKIADAQAEVGERVAGVHAKIKKVQALITKADEVMTSKITAIGHRVDDVENKDLVNIGNAVTEFLDEADRQMDEAEGEVTTAFHTTGDAVQSHVDDLKDFADETLQTLNSTLIPEEDRVADAANAGIAHLKDKIGKMSTAVENWKKHVETVLDDTEKKNTENDELLDSSKEELTTAYAAAAGAVENEKQEFNAVQQEQNAKLASLGTEMTEKIRSTAAELTTKINNEAEKAKEKMDDAVVKARGTVKSGEQEMNGEVQRVTKKIKDDTKGLDKQSATLKAMLAEAKASLGATQTSLQQDGDALDEAISSERDASRKADRDITEQMDKAKDGALAAGHRAFAHAAQRSKGAFAEAEKGASAEAEKTMKLEEQTENRLMGTVESLRRAAEAEMASANTAADKLRVEADKQRAAQTTQAEQLTARFQEIDSIGQDQVEEFDRAVDQARNLLQQLGGVESHEVAQLEQKMEDVISATKTAAASQNSADSAALDALVKDVVDDSEQKKREVEDAQGKVDQFSKQLADVEQRTSASIDAAAKQADHFQVEIAARARQLSSRLEAEKMARKNATSFLRRQAESVGQRLNDALGSVTTLGRKVGGSIEYEFGSVDLQEQKLGRRLARSLGAAQHADEKAITNLRSQLNAESKRTDELLEWKRKAERSSERFQRLAQQEFRKLGEELDMTALEEAEQHAMEQWAVQEQQNHLKQVLGDEMEKLSAAGAARLQQMAKRQGEAMAKIMADESLSEEERAEALAKLKAQARKDAMRVLEEDQQLSLDQRTASRKLKTAIEEVERTEGAIASFDSASPQAKDFASVLGRVKDLVQQANEHMWRHPDTGGQLNLTDDDIEALHAGNMTHHDLASMPVVPLEPEARAGAQRAVNGAVIGSAAVSDAANEPSSDPDVDAAQGSLLEVSAEGGVAELFRAAAAESAKAIQEDHAWRDELLHLERAQRI